MPSTNIKHTYRQGTPEELEHYNRLRKEIETEKPEISKRARAAFDNAKRTGMAPRTAIAALRHERKHQEVALDEIISRSGLSHRAVAELEDRDADPTLRTLEAYAEALGKRLLIILIDEGGNDSSLPRELPNHSISHHDTNVPSRND
ncbi:helix-turn-helix domain-containing protein [Candidatus Entotheonella palauensis]|uniref:helix-turn-helix domain-containing protein n=1 Tax=Candidatus Entotheonella palauensis TaxID=93172 RepID=UPI0011784F19|nr:helix-turn-helix transcriptional regulator [Candidatus Entotheonella palauensis]